MTPSKAKRLLSLLSFRFGFTQSLVKIQDVFNLGESNTFRILNYHRVNDFNDPFTIDSVAATDFESQMHHVSKYYHVLSLDDIYNHIQNKQNLPKQCLAITFDDGYEDNYTYAYKILKKYNLPATIFITVDAVDSQAPLWFDKVLSAFKTTSKKKFNCPLKEELFEIESIDQKINAAHVMLEKLKKLDNDQRNKTVIDVITQLGLPSTGELQTTSKLLTWSQIKEMSSNKISFGSHTMTHPILTSLPAQEMEWELRESKKILEQKIDKKVRFFAYPNGKAADFNENVVQSIKQADYKAAVTTAPDINYPFTDPYIWGRYKPWQNQVAHFATSLFVHGLSK